MVKFRLSSFMLVVTRRSLLVRRMTGFMLCFAAIAFLVWLVARGPESFRDDLCVGEKALNLPSQSRLDGYCNEPQDMRDDVFEGQLPDCMDKAHFELAQVIAVFRHGDRAPLLEITDLGGPQDFECGVTGKQWEVLEHVTVRRLVGKNEKVTFPLHPGKSGQRCRPAALTAKGFEQHHTLGELFRQRYIDSGLLIGSGDFSTSRHLFVRVTGASRCMQSAGAFLAGLHRATDAEVLTHPDMWFRMFPPQLSKRGSLEYISKRCDEALSRQREAVKRTAKYLDATEKRLKPNMARMSQWLGDQRDFLPDITFLCDVIQDEHCHGKKNFCHLQTTSSQAVTGQSLAPSGKDCLNAGEVNSIVESCDEAFTLNFSLPYSRLVIQPLLRQIVLHMEDVLGKSNNEPSEVLVRRLLLYFGHDNTLIPLLTTLGVYDGQWPPLASRMTFELWHCVTPGCQRHKVRLLYNGRPLQGDLTNTMGFCDFSELQHLVEKRQSEFLEECAKEQ